MASTVNPDKIGSDNISPSDYKRQRLNKNEARKLIARLVLNESVTFVKHAFDRMDERGLSMQDVWNVLESPDSFILGEGEFEKGSYRYRFCTNRILLALTFNPTGSMIIVLSVMRRSS